MSTKFDEHTYMPGKKLQDDLWQGLVAAQIGLATPEAVIAAARWCRERDLSLAGALVATGALTAEDEGLVERLAQRLVARQLPRPQAAWVQSLEQALASEDSNSGFDTVSDPVTPADPFATASLHDTPPSTLDTPPAQGLAPSATSRFRIVRLHARGGLGQVSLAIDEELSREVALKEIQSRFADDPASRARFVREAEITGSLEHPGIVPVYGMGVSPDGRPYYAMRFIQGRSLCDAIDEFYRPGQPDADQRKMAFRELLRRFIDVCNAMEYAHSRGVIHRDLKPANVMLGPYGETLVVDWGLAKLLDETDHEPRHAVMPQLSPAAMTMQGSTIGTPNYMSPEQALGDLTRVGTRSDIYSLGATLYHLLTAQAPLEWARLDEVIVRVQRGEIPPARQVRADVSPPLEAICSTAMALRPDARFASARALAGEVEHWLADEPVANYRERFQERWFRRMRKHRTWTMAVAVVLPLLLTIVTAATFVVEGARREAVTQRESAQHSLINLELANGARLEDEGDPGGAALWYSKSLAAMEDLDPQQARLNRLRLSLLLKNLPRPTRLWALPLQQQRWIIRNTISPNGQLVLAASGDGKVFGVDTTTGRELWPPLVHNEVTCWEGFTPDNKRIVTQVIPKSVFIWDAATGKQLEPAIQTQYGFAPPMGTSAVEADSYISPDGRWLAVVTLPGKARAVEVFNLETGAARGKPLLFPAEIRALSWSVDNQRLLIGSNNKLEVFDLATGQPIEPAINVPSLWYATFSPNGKQIVSASGESSAQLWDAQTHEPAGPPLLHRGVVTRAVFSPDSIRMLTLCGDRTVRLWDTATGKPAGDSIELRDAPFSARFSADGARFVTVTYDHTVQLFSSATGESLAAPWRHPAAPVVQPTAEGVLIANGGFGARWDVSRSARLGHARLTDVKQLAHVAFAPDGSTLAAYGGAQAWLLDPTSGSVRHGPLDHPSTVSAVALSPDGRWLAAGCADGSVHWWQADNGRRRDAATQHQGSITQLRFDPRGQRLVSCSADKTARLWDVATGKPLEAVLQHAGQVSDAAFSADGRWLITGGADGVVKVWDPATGAPRGKPLPLHERGPGEMIDVLAFHPREPVALAGGNRGALRVWDFSREPWLARSFEARSAIVRGMFSPDGRRLLTSGFDREFKVWDWQQADLPPVLIPTRDLMIDLAIHPSGEFVAATTFRGVKLIDLETGESIVPRLSGVPAKSIVFSPDGQWLTTLDFQELRWWRLQPAPFPAEQLETMCQLLATRSIDPRGVIKPLDSGQIQSLHQRLLKEIPVEFQPSPGKTGMFGAN
ncbi:MAG: protein kinase [Planctomycetes bacterium]|nr:protein kinase [Planctomycetota bacterium]